MECDPMQLQAYLDGELDPEEEEAVRRHLGGCLACRRELAALKLLWLELDRAADVEPAPELMYQRRQVLAAVRETRRQRLKEDGHSREARGQKAGSEARRAAFLWLEAQAAVWRPVFAGMQYIPGARLLSRSGRPDRDSASEEGPKPAGLLGRLLRRRRPG